LAGAAAETEEYTGAQNGYQWISWKQSGLRFCAVSDASADDLSALRACSAANLS